MKAAKRAVPKTASSAQRSAASKPVEKRTGRKADPVVHFEMPWEDGKRMAKFYQSAFGWKTKDLGKKMGNYTLAGTTDEVDSIGRPKRTGIINGGFFPKDESMPAQYPSIVIAVDDIEASMQKVEKAGGKVLGDPVEIPGFGLYVSFFDTEGNRVSIMEPTMEMKEQEKKRKR